MGKVGLLNLNIFFHTVLSEETIRTSEYIYLPQNSRRLCHISNFQWKRDVDVHFVVSRKTWEREREREREREIDSHKETKVLPFHFLLVKGLGRWVRHLIHNMEKVSPSKTSQGCSKIVISLDLSLNKWQTVWANNSRLQ